PPGTDRFALEPARGALWMIDRRPDPNRSPEVTESVFARFATSLRRLSARPVLRRVLVTHAAPAHAATYDAVFGVPVRFSAGRNALELEPWWATFALPPQPRHLRPILEAHAEEALAALDAAATWHGRVAALVTTRLGTDDVHVESISRALGMSRQTLFRRLQGEGTTYAAVLDGVRRRAAEALMTDPRVPVKQVAARTGFSDPAAFSRAYRRWTGRPPSAGRAGSTGYVAGATGRRPS
ncbi:MAG: AraC family transcriptional regulator, partial [Gemmatimonadaceae bacterium]|nr:AraC family transcriptional regulator [Gemmatimonadaceae bacterium]